jgi:hypothetical protein
VLSPEKQPPYLAAWDDSGKDKGNEKEEKTQKKRRQKKLLVGSF